MREGSHLQEGCEICLLGWMHPAEQSPNTDKEIHTFRADKQNRATSPRLTGSDGCGEVSMRAAVKIHARTHANKHAPHQSLASYTQSNTAVTRAEEWCHDALVLLAIRRSAAANKEAILSCRCSAVMKISS